MKNDVKKKRLRKRAGNVTEARLRLAEASYKDALSVAKVLQLTLDELEVLTGSKIGFYHFLEEDQETLSLQNWSTKTVSSMCTAEGRGSHYNISQAGVWVDCVRKRRPVIHNDYASLPHKKGMPDGHAPVIRQMVVPIFRGDRIVAIIGVGNKVTDYTAADVETAKLLGDFSWEIVERKRAEEALRESGEQFRALADSIPNLAWWANGDGYITWYNKRWYDYTGTTPEQMEGWGWQSVHDPHVLPKVLVRWKTSISTGEPFDMEFPLRGADGVFRPFLTRVMPLKDSGGKVLRWFGTNTDVSERKQAEEALREARDELELRVAERTAELKKERQRLYDVLETLPAMICLLTPDYHVMFANRSFREKFGESYGRHCYDYCFGKKEPCDFCESYKVLETGKPHHWEVTSPDGAAIIDAYDFPFTDVDGSPLILEMDLDITARKQAEKALKELNEKLEQHVAERTAELESANAFLHDSRLAALNMIEDAIAAHRKTEETSAALRESENRYHSLFENMTEGFAYCKMLIDDRGQPVDFVYLEVNHSFERLTGLADVVGKKVTEVIPGIRETDPEIFEIYGRVALACKPERLEFYVEALKMWFSISVYCPQKEYFVAVFDVITERKQAQMELMRLNKVLKALSDSSQAVIRAKDESEYMNEVCRIIIEDCGFSMVWIGFAENDEEKSVRPVAYAGFEEGYLETLKITWADTERGRGPTGTAIRTGKVSMCCNMPTDPAFAPWRQEAIRRGYASSIVFPLIAEDKVFGSLTIYTKEPDPFSEAEVKLLTEMTDDLAYGITTIRTRAAREQAEEALQRSLSRLEILALTAGELLQSTEPQKVVESLCLKVMEHLDCHAFFNFLVDEEKGKLHLNACAGVSEEEVKKLEWLDYGVAVCGCVARDGVRIVAEHIPTTPDERTELIKSYGIKAYVCHPLLGPGGKVIGTLAFGTRDRETFSEEDLSLVKAVADQVAMAMTRMRNEANVLKLSAEMASRNLELELVNKELESFVYSTSHDLRAPVRSMAGFAKILVEDYSGRLDEQGIDYLRRIQRGSEKMAELINDLLNLSKISRQGMNRTRIDLSLMAASIIADMRDNDPGRSIGISIAEGLTDFADQRLLEIALSNLLGNAWKFTSRTEDARIEFGMIEREGKNVYYVRDNGAGFDPQYMEKMFWPFQRLHSESEFEGTGIGLAIVERIIHRHGGKIWAEGEIGKGATVYFTLG